MINKEPFLKEIDTLKDEGKYRIFNSVLRERGKYPKAMWYSGKGQPSAGPKNIIHWCANDYLGMSQHKVVIDAARTALEETGLGAGGTRNIGGTTHYHDTLERELARLHNKESALLFTSAFNANEWSLIVLKTIALFSPMAFKKLMNSLDLFRYRFLTTTSDSCVGIFFFLR